MAVRVSVFCSRRQLRSKTFNRRLAPPRLPHRTLQGECKGVGPPRTSLRSSLRVPVRCARHRRSSPSRPRSRHRRCSATSNLRYTNAPIDRAGHRSPSSRRDGAARWSPSSSARAGPYQRAPSHPGGCGHRRRPGVRGPDGLPPDGIRPAAAGNEGPQGAQHAAEPAGRRIRVEQLRLQGRPAGPGVPRQPGQGGAAADRLHLPDAPGALVQRGAGGKGGGHGGAGRLRSCWAARSRPAGSRNRPA
jgi:hypothetical protein